MMNSTFLQIEQIFIRLQRFRAIAVGYICPFILLLVALLLQSCANDNKKAPQSSSPAATARPAQEAVQQEAAPAESQEKKESPVGKSVEELRKNKSGRIGAVPTGKDAELNTTVTAPPIKATGKSVTRVGPPGYITRENVFLQAEPTPTSNKISPLKQNETVYILGSIMTDEQGQLTSYPTWYKVERENKQRGWVVAKAVSAGGGG